MQKRMSSGFLHLRVAMLKLAPFADGLRKAYAPTSYSPESGSAIGSRS
ncbi:MAG: hypothetical protein HYV63_19270 [Candidatus Schekmanbacteria bacterium]|nr:hypothetical protein [Candidatus Schekmanbacteria bacterium]